MISRLRRCVPAFCALLLGSGLLGAAHAAQQQGRGIFRAAANVSLALDQPRAVVVGDFNSDGSLDLAVANAALGSVSIAFGNGKGAFTSVTELAAGPAPVAITTADFNSDGGLDLAVANLDSNSVTVLLGDGSGSFRQGPILDSGGIAPMSLTAGYFNFDGKLDLAVVNASSGQLAIRPSNRA